MKKNKIYIIAEIGVNHNGKLNLAKYLIDQCKKSGADAVKFQTYRSDLICADDTNRAPYQIKNENKQSQLDMLKQYELSYDDFRILNNYAKCKNIDFITTVADKSDIHFITNDLKLKFIKVGSSDLSNVQLLLHLGKTNKKILLSTGMSNIDKINLALSALAYGNKNNNFNFDMIKDRNYYRKNIQYINKKVSLFHCTTEYPAPLNELNLNVIDTFNDLYNMDIGYSDHSGVSITPIIASAKNIKYIEVHVTKSNKMTGPDHSSSLNIPNFKKYVQLIRKSELALGSSTKKLTVSEKKNHKHIIKRLFLRKNISSGQILNDDFIACKRSNTGLSADKYSSIINKTVKKDLRKGSKIFLKDLI